MLFARARTCCQLPPQGLGLPHPAVPGRARLWAAGAGSAAPWGHRAGAHPHAAEGGGPARDRTSRSSAAARRPAARGCPCASGSGSAATARCACGAGRPPGTSSGCSPARTPRRSSATPGRAGPRPEPPRASPGPPWAAETPRSPQPCGSTRASARAVTSRVRPPQTPMTSSTRDQPLSPSGCVMQMWPAEGSCSFPNLGKNAEALVPMKHASNPETDGDCSPPGKYAVMGRSLVLLIWT